MTGQVTDMPVRRRRMDAAPDQTDDALWESRREPRPWVVHLIQHNGEAVHYAAEMGWPLERALLKAFEMSGGRAHVLTMRAATTSDDDVLVYHRQIWRLWQRMGLHATRSAEDEWADLVEDWRQKQDAMLGFPLFRDHWMNLEQLPESESLVAQERAARERLDAFMAAHP